MAGKIIPYGKNDGNRHPDPVKPLPRRIADLLLARIFMGELKPGDKLPPDRMLAAQLGVDRTSLRAALSELAGRKIVKAVRGSGVVVLDYKAHAGLDFLDTVLDMSDVDLGGALHLEFLNHWLDVMPAIIRMAVRRAMPADLAAIDGLFQQQLDLQEKSADPYELALVEVEIQDVLVRLAGSTILRLFANSMRKLRIRFVLSFYKSVTVGEHILFQRDLLQRIPDGELTPDEIAVRYRDYLWEHTRVQRERIARMPPNPGRRKYDGQWEKVAD